MDHPYTYDTSGRREKVNEGARGAQLPSNLEVMTHGRPFLFPMASHSVKTGKLTGEAFSAYVEKRPELEIRDLAYSLIVRRSMHKFRSFAVSSDGDGLLGDFADLLPVAAWTAALPEKVRIGFVYWSNNNQWLAMGRELIQKSPLFKQTLQRCDNILSQLPDAPEWSVVEELLKSQATSRLAATRSGEIGAAYAAGILSFENAMIAAYYRGLYMSNGPDDSIKGAMMGVGLTEEQARVEIEPYTGLIAVAAINSPPTFHSHHMFPLAPGYLQALEKHTKFTTHSAQRRMFSSVTGKPAQPSLMDPQYWVDNMVGTVRFSDATVDVLMGIGPHPALKGSSRQILEVI
ncbi:hypothetical protein TCE0_060r19348 [Talaromyces pinophilus]|uniref:Malonyl-CoA:ACP transacylase (MAT) domain-containing protein n=1 Tax=Talaromyces pinophilus TaxID=128442 RepID=A0A6V8HRF9_TALPI|nr:hypothetical protein TCE0_060r19348 [Talaromyces pinophilus]